jgi:hypothetical protein
MNIFFAAARERSQGLIVPCTELFVCMILQKADSQFGRSPTLARFDAP